jgi:hypothetical protein
MASAALIDDRLQIDGFNAYTWTGTFGVPTDGFYKNFMDGSYVSQIDETPQTYTDENTDLDHFNPLDLNRSGPMYLKEASVNPAPWRMFPARKYELDNGVVTWERPDRPAVRTDKEDNRLLIILILVVIGVVVLKNVKF